MRALVVYESMYGNTRKVAQAIAAGIGERFAVKTLEVGEAAPDIPVDVDLLVVGGPTHVHWMSRPNTRSDAATRSSVPVVSDGIGMREWLDTIRPATRSMRAAAFDTRIKGPSWVTGSAAHGFAKLLQAAGFQMVEPPHNFLVQTKPEPVDELLVPGELEQAHDWGRALAEQLAGKTIAVE